MRTPVRLNTFGGEDAPHTRMIKLQIAQPRPPTAWRDLFVDRLMKRCPGLSGVQADCAARAAFAADPQADPFVAADEAAVKGRPT